MCCSDPRDGSYSGFLVVLTAESPSCFVFVFVFSWGGYGLPITKDKKSVKSEPSLKHNVQTVTSMYFQCPVVDFVVVVMCMCARVNLCAPHMSRFPWRLEEGVRSSGTGVTLPGGDDGN